MDLPTQILQLHVPADCNGLLREKNCVYKINNKKENETGKKTKKKPVEMIAPLKLDYG